MRFVQYKDFFPAVRVLFQKGGPFQAAAKTVEAIWGRANLNMTFKDVFHGIQVTNHGENRVAHCVKYDLTHAARLVTVKHNDICMFLFAGDHDAVDKWLDKNRGMVFVAKQEGDKVSVTVAYVGNLSGDQKGLIRRDTDFSPGVLIDLLSQRQQETLLDGLNADLVADVSALESIASDDEIESLVSVVT